MSEERQDDRRQGAILRELLELARSGDREALGRALESQRPGLRALCRRRFGDPDISDHVQNTMARALTGFADFRGEDEASFRSWLGRILLNELRHSHRRRGKVERREPFEQGPTNDDTPSAEAVLHEKARLLTTILRTSHESDVELFFAHIVGGESFEIIAQRSGTNPAAVQKRCSRLRVRICEAMSADGQAG